jgi:hypothetical protein
VSNDSAASAGSFNADADVFGQYTATTSAANNHNSSRDGVSSTLRGGGSGGGGGWSSAAGSTASNRSGSLSSSSSSRRHPCHHHRHRHHWWERHDRPPNIATRTRAKHSLRDVGIEELEKPLLGLLEENDEYVRAYVRTSVLIEC